jgi:hypothetical protein
MPMKSGQMLFHLFLAVTALSAVGCATSSLYIPPRPSPMHSLEKPQVAKLRIPIVVILPSLKDVEKHLDEALKKDAESVEQKLTKKFGTKVWWDPLDWKFEDNHLTAKMNLHYKGQKPSAQEEAAQEDIEKELHSKVGSAVQWKGWHLEAPDFKENTVEAEVENEAKKGEHLLRKGTNKFNEDLKNVSDMEKKFKEVWDELQEPIPLGDDVWLQVLPHHLSIGDTHLIADPKSPRMETVFELYAVPKVIIGGKPETKKIQLPPLQDYIPGGEGFHIVTNLKIKFDQVNKLLMDPKTGVVNMALPGGEDYNVHLTSIRIYGSGEKIVVEAGIDYSPLMNLSKKPAHMTVYLVGTPTYHQKTQVIDFPDMDFDVKSSDFLVQLAVSLDAGGIRDELRKHAAIPIGADLDKLRTELNKLMNRPLGPHVILKTTISTLKMKEAYVSAYGIEGRVTINGDAAVNLVW